MAFVAQKEKLTPTVFVVNMEKLTATAIVANMENLTATVFAALLGLVVIFTPTNVVYFISQSSSP